MKRFYAILLLLGLGISGFGQSRKELEDRKESTLREIQITKEILDKTTLQKKNSINRLVILNKGIESSQSLIFTINNEIDILDNKINDLETEIERIESEIHLGKQEYADILYYIYKNHTEEEKLMYLLASKDINQFYQRVKYLKYLKDYREKKVLELEDLKKELVDRTTELIHVRNEKTDLLKEKENEALSLQSQRIERNNIIQRLSQDEQRIKRQIAEKERIRKELEAKIRKIIEEEARRSASNSVYSSLTPEQKLVGNNFLQNKGRLPWPVDKGTITENFGLVPHPVLSGVKIPNNGIVISSVPGTRARAVFDGEVTAVFAILGANYAVMIKHGEFLSVYQNLVDLQIKDGEKVKTKQVLGTVHADDGVAVLTFQIWKAKDILDPAMWISK